MEVKCEFYTRKVIHRILKSCYVCHVTELPKNSKTKEIKSFKGRHEWFKSKKNVIWMYFEDIPLGFVPKNLDRKFPNIKFVSFWRCGIEKISRNDLNGLENVEYIDFQLNQLRMLPDNLFADMKKLREIRFADNKLEWLSSKLLRPIEATLEVADFRNNTKIDEYFDRQYKCFNDLAELKRIIDVNCLPTLCLESSTVQGSHAVKVFEKLHRFKITNEFSDFTIKLQGKEFRIHRNIFAAQSAVFKRIFSGEIEEGSQQSFRKIKKASEKTVDGFLDYFYTGKVDVFVNLPEMLELAVIFDVSELKATCFERIKANLNESNAVEVFKLAVGYQSEELKQKSFEVIKKMFPGLQGSCDNQINKIDGLMALKNQMDALKLQMEALAANNIREDQNNVD